MSQNSLIIGTRDMKSLKVILVICCVVLLNACAATLLPVSVTKNSSLDKYRYVYITPTSGITSTTGGVYGGSYGVYGSTQTKSIYPSDIIAGIMIKKGFTQVPNITPEIADQTLIINYGESGRRNVGLGYTIEITLQFLTAKTHEVVCTSTAEGQGSTETDDIRIAINRALDEVFPSK